jgi:hypothetical protein
MPILLLFWSPGTKIKLRVLIFSRRIRFFLAGIAPRELKFDTINRKFRVPRKQGAHFLSAQAQIQDSWFFSASA